MQTGKTCKGTIVILFHLFFEINQYPRNIFFEHFITGTCKNILYYKCQFFRLNAIVESHFWNRQIYTIADISILLRFISYKLTANVN